MGHMRPWRQARPTWDYAAELILKAAISGRRADIEAATDQRALRRENWLDGENTGVAQGSGSACDNAGREW
jgi:hypothetical protein